MKYILVGNYGVGNLGDEALKDYFLQKFSDVEWVVVGVDVPRFPGGFRTFLKFDWFKTIGALRTSDGIVFGGGSLFTDVESSYACFLWWVHAFWARIFRKKIILAFQGIGPFRTSIGTFFAQWVVRRAAFISVRDSASFERVNTWKKSCEVVQSFDPIFSLVEAKNYDLDVHKNLVVIPRKNSGEHFRIALLELLKSDRWNSIIFLSLQPEDKHERQVLLELRKLVDVQSEIFPVVSLSALVEGVSRGSFILSHRYHGALVALALGREVQVVQQGTDDKLASIQHIIDEMPLFGRKEYLQKLVTEGEENFRKILCKACDKCGIL